MSKHNETKPVRDMQIKIVKIERAKLYKKQIPVFCKYADKIIEIVSKDAKIVEREMVLDLLIKWKDNILENGYQVHKDKTSYFGDIYSRISSIKSFYKKYNSDASNEKINALISLEQEIANDQCNKKSTSPVSLNTPKRVNLNESEIKLFSLYSSKLISIIYNELCDLNPKNKILVSTITWKNNFIKNGYHSGKRHEIIIGILEKITMLKIYFEDYGIDTTKNFLPIEEMLKKDPIYLEYIEKHPKYDYTKI